MNNDCNNDSQLSPTDLNKQQQDSYIGFPGSSNTLIRWNDTLQSLVVGVLGATLLYQLILHQQHHARGWDFSEIALRDFADTWTSYMGHLQTNPILTKAITSGTVYTIGDVIAQRTEQQRNNGANGNISLDGMRVLRSSLAGLIGHGPLSHAWYNVCDYSFENILHLSAAWWPLKILIDQTVWGPIWNNTYIVMLGLMKRETLEAIWSDMKRTTVPLIVSGLKLWPLAHCVTYGLIPKENRVLWVDMVEIVWVTILATQAAGHTQATLEAEEQHAKGKNT
jgi:protein Mpv17